MSFYQTNSENTAKQQTVTEHCKHGKGSLMNDKITLTAQDSTVKKKPTERYKNTDITVKERLRNGKTQR